MRFALSLVCAVAVNAWCNQLCYESCVQQNTSKVCSLRCGCEACAESCINFDRTMNWGCVRQCERSGGSWFQRNDQTTEVSSCSEDCQATCGTAPCLSMCLSEFCSSAETGNVTYFFIGVVLFLGIISLTYEVLYGKEIKNRLQKRALRP